MWADTFSYDQANRLKAATAGGTSSSYVYNGDGDRTSKSVGGVTTSYLYDVNRSLPVVLDDGSRKYVWGPGLAYAVASSGNPIVYHTDGLGSIRAITDSTGAVVETYRTDEFGAPTTQGTVTQPFGYTGEIADPETGLVYLRARYYDPTVGRFISRDSYPGSMSSPSSLNRYSYAGNNPVGRVDPSGRFWWWVIGGAIGAGTYAVTHWDDVRQGNINWVEAAAYTGSGALGGGLVGVAARMAAPGVAALASNGGWAGTASSTLYAVSRWQDAEAAVAKHIGVAENNADIFLAGMTQARRPDFLSWAGGKSGGGLIADSKFVRSLDLTDQLSDFLVIAQQWKLDYYIFIRQGTVISDRLRDWATANGVEIIRHFR